MADVPAHKQPVTHRYVISYPEHEPRTRDPWHSDFLEWKRRRRAAGTYWCDFAHQYRDGDTSECAPGPKEAHHDHIEFAMVNGLLVPANYERFEKRWPGITQDRVGEWIDTDPNLILYCPFHHRGNGGVHTASASDFEASTILANLLS